MQYIQSSEQVNQDELLKYLVGHQGSTAKEIRRALNIQHTQSVNRKLYDLHRNGRLFFTKKGFDAPKWFLWGETHTSPSLVSTPSLVSSPSSTPTPAHSPILISASSPSSVPSSTSASLPFGVSIVPRSAPFTLEKDESDETRGKKETKETRTVEKEQESEDEFDEDKETNPEKVYQSVRHLFSQPSSSKVASHASVASKVVSVQNQDVLWEIFVDCSSSATLLQELENLYTHSRQIQIQAFPDCQFNGYGVSVPADSRVIIWKHPHKLVPLVDKNIARSTTIVALIMAVHTTLSQATSIQKKRFVIVSHSRTVFSGLEYFVKARNHEFLLSNDLQKIYEFLMNGL